MIIMCFPTRIISSMQSSLTCSITAHAHIKSKILSLNGKLVIEHRTAFSYKGFFKYFRFTFTPTVSPLDLSVSLHNPVPQAQPKISPLAKLAKYIQFLSSH